MIWYVTRLILLIFDFELFCARGAPRCSKIEIYGILAIWVSKLFKLLGKAENHTHQLIRCDFFLKILKNNQNRRKFLKFSDFQWFSEILSVKLMNFRQFENIWYTSTHVSIEKNFESSWSRSSELKMLRIKNCSKPWQD